jgi:predicted amidophosphoribosyltransferase
MTWLICPMLAVLGVVLLYFRTRYWPRLREMPQATPRCDACGYDLRDLELPRCPECGALRGFKVPMTELGISEEELRENAEQKAKEMAHEE